MINHKGGVDLDPMTVCQGFIQSGKSSSPIFYIVPHEWIAWETKINKIIDINEIIIIVPSRITSTPGLFLIHGRYFIKTSNVNLRI